MKKRGTRIALGVAHAEGFFKVLKRGARAEVSVS